MSAYWDQFDNAELDDMQGKERDEDGTDMDCIDHDTDLDQDDRDWCRLCGGNGCNFCL